MNFLCKNVSKSWKLLYVLKAEHIFTTRTQKSDWEKSSPNFQSEKAVCGEKENSSHFLSLLREHFHKYMCNCSCWKRILLHYNLLFGVATTTMKAWKLCTLSLSHVLTYFTLKSCGFKRDIYIIILFEYSNEVFVYNNYSISVSCMKWILLFLTNMI